MKTTLRRTLLLLSALSLFVLMGFANPINKTSIRLNVGSTNELHQKALPDNTKPDKTVYKVTFIELGSVRCIPCQQMQKVMKAVEQKYGKQVKVIFHDVWTEEGKPFGKQYNITAIPTQILLDEKGKEVFRHVGFFSEEDLVKELKKLGVQ